MYCARCKEDKSPHLFAPYQAKKEKRNYCRKCMAEMNHDEFGAIWKGKEAVRRIARAQMASDNQEQKLNQLRKQYEHDEIERLIEQRKARLIK